MGRLHGTHPAVPDTLAFNRSLLLLLWVPFIKNIETCNILKLDGYLYLKLLYITKFQSYLSLDMFSVPNECIGQIHEEKSKYKAQNGKYAKHSSARIF